MHKKKAKRRLHPHVKKSLTGCGGIVVVAAVVLGYLIFSFDVNRHRAAIENALSREMGHTVRLGGRIHVGLSRRGLTLSVHDAAFLNPPWASRANLANVKSFDLEVGLIPLLSHRVDIQGLQIEDADILIEAQNDYRHNWEKYDVEIDTARAPPQADASAPAVDIKIASLSIKNSRIGMRGPDGKETDLKVDDLTLGAEEEGIALHFGGSMNNLPLQIAATTNAVTLMSMDPRPVDVTIALANYHLAAQGTIDFGQKQAAIDHYEFDAISTVISGRMIAAWGGARPEIRATIVSDNILPADLKFPDNGGAGAGDMPGTSVSPYVISAKILPFDSLKSADMNLDIAIGHMPFASLDLGNIKARLLVDSGRAFLSPVVMNVGNGTFEGQFNLDAAQSPARFGTSFALNGVDLGDLIQAGGVGAFLSVKVKVEAYFSSTGSSLHELAGNLNGPVTMIGAGGDVVSTAANGLSAAFSEILAPGTGNAHEGMNCVVARFIARDGVLKSNGILIDTAAATAAGYGDIDLRSESVNLDFHAKPKSLDVGGLLPPLHIGGTLRQPDLSADARAVMQNVGTLLTGGAVADQVPDVMTQQGQNACAYALDHPTSAAAPADKGGVVQDLAGKAGQMLKGFFGK